MWFRIVLVSLLSLIVYASIARSESKIGNTGIRGVIMVTPIRPGPVRKGSESPNAAPLPNATFRITSHDGVVTTFTTDTQGHFHVPLKPGHYSILLAENRFPKPCGPFEIDVAPGKITKVEWRCDSGMR
jgi:prealbumin domain-containing protein